MTIKQLNPSKKLKNKNLEFIYILPITTKVKRDYIFQTKIGVNGVIEINELKCAAVLKNKTAKLEVCKSEQYDELYLLAILAIYQDQKKTLDECGLLESMTQTIQELVNNSNIDSFMYLYSLNPELENLLPIDEFCVFIGH